MTTVFLENVTCFAVATAVSTTSSIVTTRTDTTTKSISTSAASRPGHDTVSSPVTETILYVSSQAGADTSDGLSVPSALKTLRKAATKAGSKTLIYVMEGEYNNNNFGGGDNNGAVMNIKGLQSLYFNMINDSFSLNVKLF